MGVHVLREKQGIAPYPNEGRHAADGQHRHFITKANVLRLGISEIQVRSAFR